MADEKELELDDELTLDDELDDLETEIPDDDELETPPKAAAPEAYDDDKEEYSKRVQKRINKLTRQYKEEHEAREAERQHTAKIEERLRELESRIAETDQAQEEAQIQSKLEQARAKYRQSFDDGDSAEADRAMMEIVKLQTEAATRSSKKPPPKQTVESPAPAPASIPKAEQTWQKRNPWFTDPTKKSAQSVATGLYQQLLEEGYDPEDESLYSELDNRLKVSVPGIVKSKRPGSPVTAGSRTPISQGKRAKITAADLASMSKYNLNPNSPEDRKIWMSRNDPL